MIGRPVYWLGLPRPPAARSAFLRQQLCVTEAGLLPERPGVRANTKPLNPNWHRRGAEGLPLRVLNLNTVRLDPTPLSVTTARLPDVGFQARDRTARPCGREGELDPRAAMCGRGRARWDREKAMEK